MENPIDTLDHNLEALATQIVALKFCSGRVVRKDPKRMEGWLESTQSAMTDFVEIRREWNKLKGDHFNNLKTREALNCRVIDSLKAAVALKKVVQAIMELIETLSNEVKTGEPKQEAVTHSKKEKEKEKEKEREKEKEISLTGEKGDKPKSEWITVGNKTMQIWEVEQSFKELHVELTYLKHIINGLDQNGDPQVKASLSEWEGMSGENKEMQNQFQKLRRPNQNGRMDMEAIEGLNTKATETLETVKALKQPAFETFLRHASSKMNRYSHEELTIFTSEFSTEIGSGGFSKVYKCLLADGITQGAVKVLAQKDDKEKDFLRDVFVIEVGTMIKASHPNLIKLYGFCFDANMQALVYEYMEMGSLDRVLFKKEIDAEWQTLYDIATDVAQVVAYLHEECGDHQIIHHDIKPGNVLIDSSLFPKLTDFGVSKIMSKDASHFARTSLIRTSSYIAPEMKTLGSKVTCRCDVFSFGMLLFDIFGMRINSECQPFFPNKVWNKFHKGEVDEIMKDCHIDETDKVRATILCRIAFWCIQFTAEDRPSMKDVVNILENELLVPMSHTPFYVTEGESFSLQQSHDGTKYLKVSRSTSTSHHKRKVKNYKANVKKWQKETFEKDFVDLMPRSELKEVSYKEIMRKRYDVVSAAFESVAYAAEAARAAVEQGFGKTHSIENFSSDSEGDDLQQIKGVFHPESSGVLGQTRTPDNTVFDESDDDDEADNFPEELHFNRLNLERRPLSVRARRGNKW